MNRLNNNRQSFLGDNIDTVLENCIVGVVGLGGGGSQIVQQLAHVGFKNYVLCDFDVIEETNLNRLVGANVNDVMQSSLKIDISERLILGLVPSADITKITERFQKGLQTLQKCHIIFGCLDDYMNRSDLEKFARYHDIPYIDVGMDVHVHSEKIEPPRMSGQVIASLPGKPCLHCYGFITEAKLAKEAQAYGDAGDRPQVIWPNSILTSTAIGIALNLLLNWTRNFDNQILYYSYDGNSGEVKKHLFNDRQKEITCMHFPL